MNDVFSKLLVVGALLILPASSALGLTFEQTKMLYERKVEAINATEAVNLKRLASSYRGKLDALFDVYSKRGDLDAALAVKKEIARIESDEFTEPTPAGDFSLLLEAQGLFENAVELERKKIARENREAQDRYVELLENLVVDLTREQKLEEAIKARAELERIRKRIEEDRGGDSLENGLAPDSWAVALVGTRWNYHLKRKGEPVRTELAFLKEEKARMGERSRIRWEPMGERKIRLIGRKTSEISFDADLRRFTGVAPDGSAVEGTRIE